MIFWLKLMVMILYYFKYFLMTFFNLCIAVGALCGLDFKCVALGLTPQDILGAKIHISKTDGIKFICPVKTEKLDKFNLLHFDQWSKRDFFGLTGIACAFNRLTLHPEVSILSDMIKQIVGKDPHWDRPINYSDEMSRSIVLKCTEKTIYLLKSATHCEHEYYLVDSRPATIIVETDASKFCFAYSILGFNGEYFDICNHIGLFKSTSLVWHSNRKELYAAFNALNRLHKLIFNNKSISINKIQFRSDNRSVVSWIDPRQKPPTTLSVEGMAVQRIANSCREIVHELLSQYQIEISHVSGVDNSKADQLSRVMDDVIPKGYVTGTRDITEIEEYANCEDDLCLSLHSDIDSENRNDITNKFLNVSTYNQLLKRMNSLIQLQRKFRFKLKIFPINQVDTTNNCLFEYFQNTMTSIQKIALAQSLSIPINFPTSEIKEFNKLNCHLKGNILVSNDRDNPVLPPQSQLSHLIAKSIHLEFGHIKSLNLLQKFRNYVFCPDAATICKSVINQCVKCRIDKSKASTDWQSTISKPSYVKAVWHIIGVDHFNLMKINYLNQSIQVYGLIFVDKFSRFCFVQLLTSKNMSDAVQAMSGTFSIFGYPCILRCDQAFNSSLVKSFCSDHRIQLSFNRSAYNPSFSGFYERIIGLFKKAFYSKLTNQNPSLNDLILIARETISILNDRPLCPKADNSMILSPNHVVFGHIRSTTYAKYSIYEGGEVHSSIANLNNAFNERKYLIEVSTETMNMIDEFLWEHTKSTLLSNNATKQLGKPYEINEVILIKQGIKYKIGQIIELPKKHNYSTRTQPRHLLKVKILNSSDKDKIIDVDTSIVRRFEVSN